MEDIADNIGLVVGDLGLSAFEDKLSDAWPRCHDGDEAAFRVMSALYRAIISAAEQRQAELILIDVGPNLGAINRAALIASQYVTIPLAPDLFSLQGLKNLEPPLRRWRQQWRERLDKAFDVDSDLRLPEGRMKPLGYVVLQHAIRADRPVHAYRRWIERIPNLYRESVLNEPCTQPPSFENDPYRLSMLKNYRSLMPLAMEARKPMFFLRPADGAIGAHVQAVTGCYQDFRVLAVKIAKRADLMLEQAV